MNELNKTATCPICGSELHTTEKALFVEHHKRLWKKKAEECGVVLNDNYENSFGEECCYGHYGIMGTRTMRDKPAELIKWEQANPKPQIDLVEFVVLLAKSLIKTVEVNPDYLADLLARQGKSQQEQGDLHL